MLNNFLTHLRRWSYRFFTDPSLCITTTGMKIHLGTSAFKIKYINNITSKDKLLEKSEYVGYFNVNGGLAYYKYKNILFYAGDTNVGFYYGEKSEHILQEAIGLLELVKEDSNNIYILKKSPYGYSAEKFYYKRTENFDINKYSFDAKSLQKSVKENIDSSGIILFQGEPGTGKTTFIKSLVEDNPDRKFLYIPPNLTNLISTPEFIDTLQKMKDHILIIEDGENVIAKRTGGSNQAVSNILNISSGLLGDIFNIPIIITLNNDISSIDPALLRAGRLKVKQVFGKIGDKTIAELTHKKVVDKTVRKIGFKSNEIKVT